VRKAVLAYASEKGYQLDESQIKYDSVGGYEPVFPYAGVDEEDDRTRGSKNRRVEFRIVTVAPEGRRFAEAEDF